MRDVYRGPLPIEGSHGVGSGRRWAVMQAQGQLSQPHRESAAEMSHQIRPWCGPGLSTTPSAVTRSGPPWEGCALGPGGSLQLRLTLLGLMAVPSAVGQSGSPLLGSGLWLSRAVGMTGPHVFILPHAALCSSLGGRVPRCNGPCPLEARSLYHICWLNRAQGQHRLKE